MMNRLACGPLNTKGFSSKLASNQLPDTDHITYAGLFNQIKFDIGEKTNKITDLHLGFCRASNPSSASDKTVNQFLTVFMKGSSDGEPRDSRILNSVIVLDISGSMGMRLQNKPDSTKTRLELSKEAIKLFIQKLRNNDTFSLVTFDDKAYTIIKGTKKNDLDIETVFSMVDGIKTQGGTTLLSGFSRGLQVMNDIIKDLVKGQSCYQNRIIMLTDVNDNSILTTDKFINEMSNSNINTTIIGVSSDFKSSICEKLVDIKGFNYFCAVETDDLKKYLYHDFDWTFFPSCYDLEISLKSNNVKFFEVFGSPDHYKVSNYNNFGQKGIENFVITKCKSSFPSQLNIENGIIKTVGGLILVKLNPQNHINSFSGTITLKYKTLKGESLSQEYPLNYNFPEHEQFFSDKGSQEAVSAFYFVHEMKSVIKKLDSSKQKCSEQFEREEFLKSLQDLKKRAPESKIKEIQDLITFIQNYKK